MFKLLFANLKKKSKHNLALRSSLLFMALFIIVIVIFSIILTVIFSYRSNSMLTKSNTLALEQLATFTDKYIFEKIDALCETYFNQNSESQYMQNFFSRMENMSQDDIKSMHKELDELKIQNPFLENIILYNGKFDSIVSTNDGIIYGASDSRNNISVQNRFFSYLESISNDFYVPQDDNIMLVNQKESILYVHYISTAETSSFGKKDVNCVIMAIDIENINRFIEEIDNLGVQCFAILDKKSKALIHSDGFPGVEEIQNTNKSSYNKLISLPYGTDKMRYKNISASCIWMESHLKDWKYLYIMSDNEWYRQFIFILLSVAGITLIILMITYILLRGLSRKLYKPLNDVIEKAKHSLSSETHSDNEIEFLNNLIDDFSQKRIEFEKLNENYSELRLYRLASSIVNGFINNDENDITKRLAAADINFTYEKFTLIIIEFNANILKTFSYEQSDFILFDVIDVLYETFNCVASLASSDTIELVINEDVINYSKIIATLKKLIPEKSFINIYICDETDSIEKISLIHKQSIGLIKYSYIHGFDNIFYTKDLQQCEMDNSVVDSKHMNAIENALMNGDKSQFYDVCNDILSGVKTENHSFQYAQNVILRIFSAICHTAKELNISIAGERTLSKIMDNTSFDNSTIYLFELSDSVFDSIISKISSEKQDKKQILITQIKGYIDSNITEDISLATVAQQFNISTGYLSKFFKEYTSESFSKYVVEKKFNYAAYMLVEHPDMAIADISNSLGYFDTAYFSRLFKTHHGVTPVQYRKMNM